MKRSSSSERQERKEDLLRPSRYLGYDHHALAVHLFSRGAHHLAEKEFKRAVWLNPFEVSFKINLCWCLIRTGSVEEARDLSREILELSPKEKKREWLNRLLQDIPSQE